MSNWKKVMWRSVALGMMLSVGSGLQARPERASGPLETSGGDIDALIQESQLERLPERASIAAAMEEAYRLNPALPEGILEAVAFVGSRWMHRIPAAPFEGHHRMPQAYGVMGLYHGFGGFADVLGEAADALGVDEARVISDARLNVLATAALLSRYIQEEGLGRPSIEELGPVLVRLSGLPEGGEIHRYAQNSYVFDILLTLDRGHDDWGIAIPAREIVWEAAMDPETLALMRAPMVRIAADLDLVEAAGLAVDPVSERVSARVADPGQTQNAAQPTSTDYAPALWVSSPNYSSRSSSITHVAIHTVQGSYSGCISWFQNPDSDVSAHYVIRSSDGQVTQMVREYNKAWHIGSENGYTLGTEHEGYVNTSSYYTEAMYTSSANLTKDMCKSNSIDCSTCYGGASSASTQVLSSSYHVKGHQHYPNQTHTDPGQYWKWDKYKSLVAGSSGGGDGGGGSSGSMSVLDSFESSEGHFNVTPTYSGSTEGISTSSTAQRSSGTHKNGAYSEQIKLLDDSSTSANWEVRFLSGSGDPSQNVQLKKSGGKVGFWVYSGGSGMSAAVSIDDGSSGGTERSSKKTFSANTWTWLEWKLDDAAQWNAWAGNSNGQIDASAVTIDAVWFFREQTSYTVYVYIDDVSGVKN